MNNLNNLLTALDAMVSESTVATELDNVKSTVKLWSGDIECRLASIDQTPTGAYNLTFSRTVYDSETDTTTTELMPSQFEGQIGSLYFANSERLVSWLRNMKIVLGMPSGYKPSEILTELEKDHHIFFIVKSSMKQWGQSLYNVVDFAQTQAL